MGLFERFRRQSDENSDQNTNSNEQLDAEESFQEMSEAKLASRILWMKQWCETTEAFCESRGLPMDSPKRLEDRQALLNLRDELTRRPK